MYAKTLSRVPHVQLFFPMFTSHEIAVWTEHELKRLERKEKRLQKVATVWIPRNPQKAVAIDLLAESLLDQPLGLTPDKELVDLGDPFTDIGDTECPGSESDEKVVWTEDAIAQLHEGLVFYSLRLLRARGNGKEKKEILRWIFAPPAVAYATVSESGSKVWKVIQPSEVPFSFELSCRLTGKSPERLREGLVPILKDIGLFELFKEIDDAQQCKQRRASSAYDNKRSSESGEPTSPAEVPVPAVSNPLDIQHSRGAGKGRNPGDGAGALRSAPNRPVLRLRNRTPA